MSKFLSWNTLSPTTFAGIALAFLLPFATVSCDESVTFTGVELAFAQVDEPTTDTEFDDQIEHEAMLFALAALIAAVAGLVLGLARWRGVAVATWIGTAAILALGWQGLETWADVDVHAGYWLALLGYLGLSAAQVIRRRRRRRAALSLSPRTRRSRLRSAAASLAVLAALLLLGATAAALAPGEESSGDGPVGFATFDGDPAWSPRGDEIAFGSTRGVGGIHVVRSDGSCVRRVTAGEEPSWSPDGRQLAVLRCRGDGDCSVWTVARDGSRERLVAQGDFWSPQWSPDGKSILLAHTEADQTTSTWIVGVDGVGLRRLVPPWVERDDPRWSIAAASEEDVAPSPEGSRIAFSSSVDRTDNVVPLGQAIFVRDVRGGGRRRLSDPRGDGDYEPAWSPDGRSIAFQRSGEIAVMTAAGDDERVLTSVYGATDPGWSPDGRSIVFGRELVGVSFAGGSGALMVVDVDSGETRRLTWGPAPVRRCTTR